MRSDIFKTRLARLVKDLTFVFSKDPKLVRQTLYKSAEFSDLESANRMGFEKFLLVCEECGIQTENSNALFLDFCLLKLKMNKCELI
jgi:hypothetical protein